MSFVFGLTNSQQPIIHSLEFVEDEDQISKLIDRLYLSSKILPTEVGSFYTIADIEGSIFNMARQMILNNYGAETENEFVEFLARLDPEMDFTGQFEETIETPVAAGAIAGGGAA